MAEVEFGLKAVNCELLAPPVSWVPAAGTGGRGVRRRARRTARRGRTRTGGRAPRRAPFDAKKLFLIAAVPTDWSGVLGCGPGGGCTMPGTAAEIPPPGLLCPQRMAALVRAGWS